MVFPSTTTLHELIFKNDVDGLKQELAKYPAASPEGADPSVAHAALHPGLTVHVRGQTPLTLAVSMNRKECIKALLDAHASVLLKNQDGWSPYQEATSIGDREVMEWIFRRRRQELGMWFKGKGAELLESMSQGLKDFYLEMHWAFSSWIPFVSQMCPSDTYKISKKGSSIRIDTTLVGFERLSWVRGDISIIFSDTPQGPRLVICDHQRKLVQQVYPQDYAITDKDVGEEISVSLNTNIDATPDIDFQAFNLSRAQAGFWGFKSDKSERVGNLDTTVWNVESFEFVNRSRTEHLHVNPLPVQIKREQAAAAKAARKVAGGLVIANASEDSEEEEDWAGEANADDATEADYKDWSQAKRHFRELAAFRGTLDKPAETTVKFEEFFDPTRADEPLHVGRAKVEKVTRKTFKGTLWMYNSEKASATAPIAIQSPDFPIQLSMILPILDLMGMASNQHVRSLREFLNVQLPPGFPVKVEIPMNLIPLSAVITFQNINTQPVLDDSLFIIPGKKQGYRAGEVIRGATD